MQQFLAEVVFMREIGVFPAGLPEVDVVAIFQRVAARAGDSQRDEPPDPQPAGVAPSRTADGVLDGEGVDGGEGGPRAARGSGCCAAGARRQTVYGSVQDVAEAFWVDGLLREVFLSGRGKTSRISPWTGCCAAESAAESAAWSVDAWRAHTEYLEESEGYAALHFASALMHGAEAHADWKALSRNLSAAELARWRGVLTQQPLPLKTLAQESVSESAETAQESSETAEVRDDIGVRGHPDFPSTAGSAAASEKLWRALEESSGPRLGSERKKRPQGEREAAKPAGQESPRSLQLAEMYKADIRCLVVYRRFSLAMSAVEYAEWAMRKVGWEFDGSCEYDNACMVAGHEPTKTLPGGLRASAAARGDRGPRESRGPSASSRLEAEALESYRAKRAEWMSLGLVTQGRILAMRALVGVFCAGENAVRPGVSSKAPKWKKAARGGCSGLLDDLIALTMKNVPVVQRFRAEFTTHFENRLAIVKMALADILRHPVTDFSVKRGEGDKGFESKIGKVLGSRGFSGLPKGTRLSRAARRDLEAMAQRASAVSALEARITAQRRSMREFAMGFRQVARCGEPIAEAGQQGATAAHGQQGHSQHEIPGFSRRETRRETRREPREGRDGRGTDFFEEEQVPREWVEDERRLRIVGGYIRQFWPELEKDFYAKLGGAAIAELSTVSLRPFFDFWHVDGGELDAAIVDALTEFDAAYLREWASFRESLRAVEEASSRAKQSSSRPRGRRDKSGGKARAGEVAAHSAHSAHSAHAAHSAQGEDAEQKRAEKAERELLTLLLREEEERARAEDARAEEAQAARSRSREGAARVREQKLLVVCEYEDAAKDAAESPAAQDAAEDAAEVQETVDPLQTTLEKQGPGFRRAPSVSLAVPPRSPTETQREDAGCAWTAVGSGRCAKDSGEPFGKRLKSDKKFSDGKHGPAIVSSSSSDSDGWQTAALENDPQTAYRLGKLPLWAPSAKGSGSHFDQRWTQRVVGDALEASAAVALEHGVWIRDRRRADHYVIRHLPIVIVAVVIQVCARDEDIENGEKGCWTALALKTIWVIGSA